MSLSLLSIPTITTNKLFKLLLGRTRRRTCNHLPLSILIILKLFIDFSECISRESEEVVNNHLELGKQFLAKGQLGDALTHYHAAVEGDPSNYMTYFRRGTVYLALGKSKNALADFDQVLNKKPQFTPARISRGTIHLKQGDYDLAQLDFYNVLKVEPYNEEANELLRRIDPAKERKKLAEYYYANDDFLNAVATLNDLIETSPWSSELYEFRAELHLAMSDQLSAIADIKTSTKLQNDNTGGYFKLANLLYELGYASDALKSIRECLKLDPEHKDCFPLYKKIKKVEKLLTDAQNYLEAKSYEECVEAARKVTSVEKDVPMIIYEAKSLLCSCHSKSEDTTEAIRLCSDALTMQQRPNNYCDRAESYLQSEMYDDAIRDYKSALEIDDSFERAKEGLDRAQKLQKQSERRDYYKILDVKRTASKREIVKAYRKMAQKWHPDNYQTDEKMKKIAEKKFIDIAAAKEVLTDEEKRRQFDNGDDPLDPESGKGPGPRGYQFHHFHGSPFQFQFHFN